MLSPPVAAVVSPKVNAVVLLAVLAEVKLEILFVPLTDSKLPGLVVPMPRKPFVLMVRAVTEEVAKVVGLDVARYKFPPAFLNVQWSLVSEPSERANCGAVDEASWRSHLGVVVPRPR